MDDQRCPFCNGLGSLPPPEVKRIRDEQVERILLRETVAHIWGGLCDLMMEAKKKTTTVDRLRSAADMAHRMYGKLMRRDWLVPQD